MAEIFDEDDPFSFEPEDIPDTNGGIEVYEPTFQNLCLTLAQWAARKIPKRDLLLGSVFSTTTRSLLSADTGIGKTHLGFALGIHMAAGQGFCHWRAHRPARVLVVDGEMSSELVQERLADAERRLGSRPDTFYCLCKEDVEDMPPLDTEGGQKWLDAFIAHLGGVDFLILDNIMSLTVGNLKEEEDWRLVLPWLRSLTKRRVGTLLVNHTGHDKTRDYGTRTRLWQVDTAMVATKLENRQEDIAFRLEFVKARQRKPTNRADYETVDVILDNDQWRTQAAKETKKKTRYGGVQQISMDGLDQAIDLIGQPSPGGTVIPTGVQVITFEQWQLYVTPKLTHDQAKHRNQAFKLAAERLIARGAVGKHNDLVWKAY